MKKLFKLIVFFTLYLFLITGLQGCTMFRQYGNVEGVVYVPDTSTVSSKISMMVAKSSNQIPPGYKPLQGAKVSAIGSSNFTFTDSNGYFLLTHIPVGVVTLVIEPPSGSNYDTLRIQVNVEANKTVDVGTSGSVSLPGIGADHWVVKINEIDYKDYPTVKVYAQVIDPVHNSPIIGITEKNFEVYINNNKMPINSVTQASGTSYVPASICLIIDRSGSMAGINYDDKPLNDAKSAAKTFVNLMNPSDRAEIISFSDYVTVEQGFTNDKQALIDAIDRLSSGGATALYDAIWQGLDDTSKEQNPRKAVIVLTDGGENASSYEHGGGYYPDNSLVINHAKKLGIPLYTIGLQGYDFTEDSELDLQEIAQLTGGEYFYAPNSDALNHIYMNITQRVGQQYIIEFKDSIVTKIGYTYTVNSYCTLTVKVKYNDKVGEDSYENYSPYNFADEDSFFTAIDNCIESNTETAPSFEKFLYTYAPMDWEKEKKEAECEGRNVFNCSDVPTWSETAVQQCKALVRYFTGYVLKYHLDDPYNKYGIPTDNEVISCTENMQDLPLGSLIAAGKGRSISILNSNNEPQRGDIMFIYMNPKEGWGHYAIVLNFESFNNLIQTLEVLDVNWSDHHPDGKIRKHDLTTHWNTYSTAEIWAIWRLPAIKIDHNSNTKLEMPQSNSRFSISILKNRKPHSSEREREDLKKKGK